MTPHPRIRKTIKWGGAVVTLLLVAAWIGSAWWSGICRIGELRGCSCVKGRLYFWKDAATANHRFMSDEALSARLQGRELVAPTAPHASLFACSIDQGGGSLDCTFDVRGDSTEYQIAVPLYALAAASLTLTLAAWRLDTLARRRANVNLCPHCNYDRTGLAGGAACPECGAAPAKS
jgi:hypothetical protein